MNSTIIKICQGNRQHFREISKENIEYRKNSKYEIYLLKILLKRVKGVMLLRRQMRNKITLNYQQLIVIERCRRKLKPQVQKETTKRIQRLTSILNLRTLPHRL